MQGRLQEATSGQQELTCSGCSSSIVVRVWQGWLRSRLSPHPVSGCVLKSLAKVLSNVDWPPVALPVTLNHHGGSSPRSCCSTCMYARVLLVCGIRCAAVGVWQPPRTPAAHGLSAAARQCEAAAAGPAAQGGGGAATAAGAVGGGQPRHGAGRLIHGAKGGQQEGRKEGAGAVTASHNCSRHTCHCQCQLVMQLERGF